MKSFFSSYFRLALFVGVLTLAIYYIHTEYFGYKRFICNPAQLKPDHICLATILHDWNSKVLWVDARSQDAFERTTTRQPDGTWALKGIPVVPLRNDSQGEELLEKAMPQLLSAQSRGLRIVIFCDISCSSSTEIAQILRNPSLGIEAPIVILEGGWDALRRESSVKQTF